MPVRPMVAIRESCILVVFLLFACSAISQETTSSSGEDVEMPLRDHLAATKNERVLTGVLSFLGVDLGVMAKRFTDGYMKAPG